METYEEKTYKPNKYGKTKPIQYEVEGACWVCVSHGRTAEGYPIVQRNGVATSMSRYVYEDFYGRKITEGNVILHSCDNPHCINPEHLAEGSVNDNVQDKIRKGRERSIFGEKHPKAKLTEEDVVEIKTLLKRGYTPNHIGDLYGVAGSNIRQIRRGKSWRRVTI